MQKLIYKENNYYLILVEGVLSITTCKKNEEGLYLSDIEYLNSNYYPESKWAEYPEYDFNNEDYICFVQAETLEELKSHPDYHKEISKTEYYPIPCDKEFTKGKYIVITENKNIYLLKVVKNNEDETAFQEIECLSNERMHINSNKEDWWELKWICNNDKFRILSEFDNLKDYQKSKKFQDIKEKNKEHFSIKVKKENFAPTSSKKYGFRGIEGGFVGVDFNFEFDLFYKNEYLMNLDIIYSVVPYKNQWDFTAENSSVKWNDVQLPKIKEYNQELLMNKIELLLSHFCIDKCNEYNIGYWN